MDPNSSTIIGQLTLQVTLEAILGRPQVILDPVKVELILNVVDHDGLIVATFITAFLSRGVGALKLKILVLLLEILLAVALIQDARVLDLVGVREKLVAGDDVLSKIGRAHV